MVTKIGTLYLICNTWCRNMLEYRGILKKMAAAQSCTTACKLLYQYLIFYLGASVVAIMTAPVFLLPCTITMLSASRMLFKASAL